MIVRRMTPIIPLLGVVVCAAAVGLAIQAVAAPNPNIGTAIRMLGGAILLGGFAAGVTMIALGIASRLVLDGNRLTVRQLARTTVIDLDRLTRARFERRSHKGWMLELTDVTGATLQLASSWRQLAPVLARIHDGATKLALDPTTRQFLDGAKQLTP